jgi:hypothetical protein
MKLSQASVLFSTLDAILHRWLESISEYSLHGRVRFAIASSQALNVYYFYSLYQRCPDFSMNQKVRT